MSAMTMNIAAARPSLARATKAVAKRSAFAGARISSIARPAVSVARGTFAVRAEESKGSYETPMDPPMMAAAGASSTPAKTYGWTQFWSASGPGPELVNGRMAMLAFVAAAASEMHDHQTVAAQFSDWSFAVIAAVVTFSIASFVPYVAGASEKAGLGPFSKGAEMLNGRVAMLGFAALMVSEQLSGHSLF
mmetsp:Transcript_62763/g.198785  ORF Transcript_62763/g.198785 Transcript_62763/m.198785 type:complete len:191 (+) Transcript_62763:323-895(+)|eukprot:CAMPEP_0182854244 /NCGR_PEP_ID=MMETSP0034_2-20130328/1132_1 /TAXON_ID=156128 /ORGANISM="Nephroselmis pyriformis, Strain CCMP717" /LENGTH=190 /DNA_ID=CAMNT_0024985053 /DNA_START=287 /DNA_END=859 /DNA_ORIENTATION=+